MEEKNIRRVFPMGFHHYDNRVSEDYMHVGYFKATDSEENYQKVANLLKRHNLFNDWRWKDDKAIDYIHSRNGFRLKFKITENYDFSNSYVVLGCSFVEGIGVSEQETISHYIEEISGINTINFGAMGTGCDVVFYNAMWLASLPNPPKRIFILWPSVHRFSTFGLKYDDLGIWSANNSKIITAAMVNDIHPNNKNYYKEEILLDPVVQSNNKMVWKELLKVAWGNRMTELDIIDASEYNPFFDNDASTEITPQKIIPDFEVMTILNNLCARDIDSNQLERFFNIVDSTKRLPGVLSQCHWGWAKNKKVAEYLLSM